MSKPIISAILALALAAAYGQTSLDVRNPATRHTPLVLHAEIPQYPVFAISGHLSGTVWLHVVVENGAVVKATPDSPNKLDLLISAAIQNVKTWQFAAGTSDSFDVSYVFELSNNEAVVHENPRIEMELPTFVKIVAKPVKPNEVR